MTPTPNPLTAKVNGCICQTCAERAGECELVALPNHDECPDCERGNHGTRTEHPGEAGRQAMEWQGDLPGRTAYPHGRWFDDAPAGPWREEVR